MFQNAKRLVISWISFLFWKWDIGLYFKLRVGDGVDNGDGTGVSIGVGDGDGDGGIDGRVIDGFLMMVSVMMLVPVMVLVMVLVSVMVMVVEHRMITIRWS